MFAVIKIGEQNNRELNIRSEVNLSQWNPNMTIEQTISHLAIYERASFQSLMKVCESLFQIKEFWKDRKKFVKDEGIKKGRRKTDWNIFLETLNENNQIRPQKVNNLISIYQSYKNENGTIKYLYNEVGFLPANFTALYEIAAIDMNQKPGRAAMSEIIEKLNENRDLGVSEIRSIKNQNLKNSNKTLKKPEAIFKLPTNQETLGKLGPIWGEIEEYTEKINNLIQKSGVQDLKLTVENPTEKLKIIQQRINQSTKRRIAKNISLIVKKTDKVNNLNELESIEFKEKTYKTAQEDILKDASEKTFKEYANAEFRKGQEDRRNKNLLAEKNKKELEKTIGKLSKKN